MKLTDGAKFSVQGVYSGMVATARKVTPPDSTAGKLICGMYLIEVTDRRAGAFWPFHGVCVVSNRVIEGVPSDPNAPANSHTLLVFAINPELVTPTPDNMNRWMRVNNGTAVSLFFVDGDDELGAKVAEVIAQACAEGDLALEPKSKTDIEKWPVAVRSVINAALRERTGETHGSNVAQFKPRGEAVN